MSVKHMPPASKLYAMLVSKSKTENSSASSVLTVPVKVPSLISWPGQLEFPAVPLKFTAPISPKILLGVVPQEISFDSFFTVNETLTLQSGYYGVRNNQKRIDTILEKLSLADKKHARTRTLSGGMKRRLLIATALVHNPKVLVLDEPTAGVDVELRHTLWQYVEELNKAGLTILLTTHYLEEAEQLCKRVAIIDQGELKALDETKNLIKSLGNHKQLIVTLTEPIKEIPEALKQFKPTKLSDTEIKFFFCDRSVNELIKILHESPISLKDLELESEKLEDVFIELTYNSKK